MVAVAHGDCHAAALPALPRMVNDSKSSGDHLVVRFFVTSETLMLPLQKQSFTFAVLGQTCEDLLS